MGEVAVEVRELTKRYGDLLAVDHVSFKVMRGECFSMLGPNGAGKTTTVEVLECIRSATSGEASVLGYDVRDDRDAKKIKQLIGVMPQEFEGVERLTAKENVELVAGIYGVKPDLRGLFESLGIWEYRNTPFMKLSGGLKRRLGIAMALVSDPELLFLDEPTTGLDPYARRETWRFIKLLKKEKKTVFLTTHYLEEAERLSDRVAIMFKGRVVALGDASQLIAEHGSGVRLFLKGEGQFLEKTIEKMGFQPHQVAGGDGFVISGLTYREATAILSELYDSGFVGAAEMTRAGLEEVFLRLTGARLTETGELA